MEFVDAELNRIEQAIDRTTQRHQVLESLRNLGLDDFGLFVFSLPDARYPRLSSLLPTMATAEVQRNWTGDAGVRLLQQTLDFVRSVVYNYTRYSGQSLDGKTVLDFGCGYGRIARLLYYFVEPARFFGVDPWEESIRLCAESGLTENFLISDYLPDVLPTDPAKFDLIYAFSVFTHLSERATRTSIGTLLARLAPGGLLVITIRPLEYWHIDRHAGEEPGRVDRLTEAHRHDGFAFIPHQRTPVDGDITYGDTSLSFDWLTRNFSDLRIRGIDRSIDDPYQIYVFIDRI